MGAEPLVRRTVDKAKAPPAKAGAPQAGAAKGVAKPPTKQPAAKLTAKAKPTAGSNGKASACKAPAVKVKLTKPVVDMIKWMNDSGELGAELRLGAVAVPLAAISQEDALELLEACFDFPSGRRDPIAFVKEAAKELAAQAAQQKEEQVESQLLMNEETMIQNLCDDKITDWTAQGSEQSLVVGKCPQLPSEVLDLVDRLVIQGVLPKTTDSDKLGAFLVFLGEGPALEVLTDLGGTNLGSDMANNSPAEFIIQASRPILIAERGSDFARRLSQRLRWMSIYLGFLSPLDVSQASFELAWIGEVAALQVLKRMVTGASVGHLFADPTEWIRKESRILSGEQKILDEKEKREKEEKEKEMEVEKSKREKEEKERDMEREKEMEKKKDQETEKEERTEANDKDGENKENMEVDHGKEERAENPAESTMAVDRQENGKAADVEMAKEGEAGDIGERRRDEDEQPKDPEENFDDVPIV